MAEQVESPVEGKIREAIEVLEHLDFPRAQKNVRSALVLLALLDLRPNTPWANAKNPLMGITPIMDWCSRNYDRIYAPNTRETFRRQTVHQFMEAALAVPNPDQPDRPVNSPKSCYQVEPEALCLLRFFDSPQWQLRLAEYKRNRQGLQLRYARQRKMHLIPITVADGTEITLTPGKHNELIKAVVDKFAPRFVAGGKVIYVGDTGKKWAYFDTATLRELSVEVDSHGKMPDVALYLHSKNWLLLIEAVTSHGPVDSKRHDELTRLFGTAAASLIFVTAFPTRTDMARYLADISWETDVWIANAPDHLIHFDGEHYLSPSQ